MIKRLAVTIIRMITAPDVSWRKLSAKKNHELFLTHFLHPMFGLVALASFIGGLWVAPNGNVQLALKSTIVNVVTVYGGYFIGAYVLNELLPRFNIAKNEREVQQFVGYASALLYSLFIVLPFLSDFYILWVFALYTSYIVYTGYGIYIRGEERWRMNFTGVATGVILLVPVLIKGILLFVIK